MGVCMHIVPSSSKLLRFSLLLLSLLVCTSLNLSSGRTSAASRAHPTNWPSFGFDARHSRFNPYEHVLNRSNVSSLKKAWSFPTENYNESSPAVVNGVAYFTSSNSNFYAITIKTGKQLWNFHMAGPSSSSPAVVNGVVYFGSVDDHVYALNAATGKQVWSFATKSTVNSSPTVVKGVLYIGSDD